MDCVILPPGYTLLERSGGIVLAFNPNNAFGKYVTWQVDYTGTGVHSGHYCQNIQRAVQDFVERSGEEKIA